MLWKGWLGMSKPKQIEKIQGRCWNVEILVEKTKQNQKNLIFIISSISRDKKFGPTGAAGTYSRNAALTD